MNQSFKEQLKQVRASVPHVVTPCKPAQVQRVSVAVASPTQTHSGYNGVTVKFLGECK